MKLILLVLLFCFCVTGWCGEAKADTLYRMDEKGIYYLSQDTVYTELWPYQAVPLPLYDDLIPYFRNSIPYDWDDLIPDRRILPYYERQEKQNVYKPFKWLIGGLIIGAGVTSSQWQIATFSLVCGGIFIFGD